MHSIRFPGILLIVLFGSALVIQSCSSHSSAPAPINKEAPIVFDSLKKNHIDSVTRLINDVISRKRVFSKKIPYALYNPTDSIGYLFLDEHMGKVSMNMHPDSNIIWPYFFIYDGELISFRLRTYIKNKDERSASEMVLYLDKGKIVYCQERKKVLDDKEIPGAVQLQPFVKSPRTYGDLENEYKKYWLDATSELKKFNVLPEWLKVE